MRARALVVAGLAAVPEPVPAFLVQKKELTVRRPPLVALVAVLLAVVVHVRAHGLIHHRRFRPQMPRGARGAPAARRTNPLQKPFGTIWDGVAGLGGGI